MLELLIRSLIVSYIILFYVRKLLYLCSSKLRNMFQKYKLKIE